MDKKRIDRIVREEVATLLESSWNRRRGTTLSRSEYFGGNLPGSDDEMRPRRRSAEHLKLDFLGGKFAGGRRLVWPPQGSSVIRDGDVDDVNYNIMSVLQDEDMATNGVEALSGPRGKDGIRAVITVLRSEEPRMENKFICAIQDLVTGKQYGSNGPQETPVDAIRSAEEFWLPDSMASLEEPGPMGSLSEARWAKLSGLNEAGPRIGAYGGEMPRGGYFSDGPQGGRDEGPDLPSGPEKPPYMTMSDREFDRAVAKSAEIMAGGVTGGPRTKTDVRDSGDVILSAEMSTNDMSYSGIKIPASIGERLGQPDGDMVRVRNEIKMPRAALPGGMVGTGYTEIDGSGYGGGGYKVTGTNIGTAGGYGPRRSFVGTGGTIEDAYRAMLDKVIATYENARDREVPSDVRAIRQWASVGVPGGGMSSLSESRWGQLAGLMTEGKRSKVSPAKKGEAQKLFVDDEDGEPILYMGPAGMSHSAAMGDKRKLRKVTPGQALAAMEDDPDMAAAASGTADRDEIMGHLRDMAEDRKEAGKLKRGVRPMPEPADLDEADPPRVPTRPAGAAPGSDPQRLPKPPNPEDGPPSHKKLDRIKDLGPFERKKR